MNMKGICVRYDISFLKYDDEGTKKKKRERKKKKNKKVGSLERNICN